MLFSSVFDIQGVTRKVPISIVFNTDLIPNFIPEYEDKTFGPRISAIHVEVYGQHPANIHKDGRVYILDRLLNPSRTADCNRTGGRMFYSIGVPRLIDEPGFSESFISFSS